MAIQAQKKPIYGRLGENISVVKNGETVNSSGDFEDQQMIYQNYYLAKDTEGYSYQIGIFTQRSK
jgi:glutathionylspermidine synthase